MSLDKKLLDIETAIAEFEVSWSHANMIQKYIDLILKHMYNLYNKHALKFYIFWSQVLKKYF